MQDLAEFAARAFFDRDAGDETEAESVESIVTMFARGNQVEASMPA